MVVLERNRIKLLSRYGLCNDIVKSSPSFPRRKTRLKIALSLDGQNKWFSNKNRRWRRVEDELKSRGRWIWGVKNEEKNGLDVLISAWGCARLPFSSRDACGITPKRALYLPSCARTLAQTFLAVGISAPELSKVIKEQTLFFPPSFQFTARM